MVTTTIDTTTEIDFEDRLLRRGILDAARAAGWHLYSYVADGGPQRGWRYPVYDLAGEPHEVDGKAAYRWKAVDSSAKPKYRWLPSRPERARYYLLPGFTEAVAAAGGLCYLASGEPDVLAYRAAGIVNVFCWFDGETSVPLSLAEDLALMGVRELTYAPDRDETGLRSAAKVTTVLGGKGIDLYLARLPGDVGTKMDINVFWQDCAFDPAEFAARLEALPVLPVPEYGLYIEARGAGNGNGTGKTAQTLADGALFREWIVAIIGALGNPATMEGSIERWHCPTGRHANGDQHPSLRIAVKGEIPWPMCTCGIQDEENAWAVLAAAVGVDSWAEFKMRRAVEAGNAHIEKPVERDQHREFTPQTQQAAPSQTFQQMLAATQAQAAAVPARPVEPFYVSSIEVYAGLRARLERSSSPPEVEPIEFPFKKLHRFGGFARIMYPGKFVYVLGISGGGKTSFGETCAEALARDGYDILWWGPEWSPEESGLRSLQRAGGPTLIDMAEDTLEYIDQTHDVLPKVRRGRALDEQRRQEALRLVDELEGRSGHIYYIDPKAKLSFDEIAAGLRLLVPELRAAGRKVPVLFLDYAQLMRRFVGSGNAFWAEDLASMWKQILIELQLVGFLLVQPKKDDGQAVKNQGEALTAQAAQSLSDQQCNLYLTLSPHYDLAGKLTQWGTISIVKNSMGGPGDIEVQTDLARLRWIDD